MQFVSGNRAVTCAGFALLLLLTSAAAGEPAALRRTLEGELDRSDLHATYEQLTRQLQQLDQSYLATRAHPELKRHTQVPDIVRRIRTDPLSLLGEAESLAMVQGSDLGLGRRLSYLFGAIDVEPNDVASSRAVTLPPAGSAPGQHLDFLVERIEAAKVARDHAFAALDPSELRALHLGAMELLEVLRVTNHLEDLLPDEPDVQTRLFRAMGLVGRIDRSALLRAALELAPLTEPPYLDRLARDLGKLKRAPTVESDVAQGRVLATRSTSAGPLVIGGLGANTYTPGAALILDLGGDDTYVGRCGSVVLDRARPGKAPLPTGVAVVIDLSGDDQYRAEKALYSQGSAVCGVALVIDRKGKDRYEGGQCAQGCGLFGVGALVDLAGNDRYVADSFSQGCGAFGVGLLLDAAGDDELSGAHFCAGVGLSLGLGALIDQAGNDTRNVSGKNAIPPEGSWYDTPGQWQGMCLGAGMGLRAIDGELRCFVPGGVGLVVDVAGDDRVTAGEFGVGCGYFFSLGVYADLAGDDTYHSARYGTGIGVHQAVGCTLDLGGMDTYTTEAGPHCGGSWDAGVGCFYDAAGSDTYRSRGSILLGTATITSLALFCDGDGRDTYEVSGSLSGGSAGHTGDKQRGTVSLGMFLDLGNDKDDYRMPESVPVGNGVREARTGRHDGQITGRGLFIDR